MISLFSRLLGPFPVISFSQIIRRRIKKLPLFFKSKSYNLFVGCDGTAVKVSEMGEWIQQKWKIRQGWIKVVIMGDVGGNIVDIPIGNGNMDERSTIRGMIQKNKSFIEKVLIHVFHYCKEAFNLCKQEKRESATEGIFLQLKESLVKVFKVIKKE